MDGIGDKSLQGLKLAHLQAAGVRRDLEGLPLSVSPFAGNRARATGYRGNGTNSEHRQTSQYTHCS